MNVSLISSIVVNILLLILLLLMMVLYFMKGNGGENVIINQQPTINPPPPVCPVQPEFNTGPVYVIKTLNGLFLQGCFGCLDSPVACIERGIIAAPEFNEDKFKFISLGNNLYNILFVKWEGSSVLPKLYLNMVKRREEYILCLTENPNQTSAQFQVISYSSPNGNTLYQIGSVISGSLLGEGRASCLIKEGIPIVDGYNLSTNAPMGMDERSLFMIIPASFNI